MTEALARAASLEILASAGSVLLGTVDAEGYPHAKAMPVMAHDELKLIWFATKASSNRVARIRKNPKTCVYFCNPKNHLALLITGRAEVMTDRESRKRVWRDGFERVYPKGLDDPAFAVIRFRTIKVTFTHGRDTVTFAV